MFINTIHDKNLQYYDGKRPPIKLAINAFAVFCIIVMKNYVHVTVSYFLKPDSNIFCLDLFFVDILIFLHFDNHAYPMTQIYKMVHHTQLFPIKILLLPIKILLLSVQIHLLLNIHIQCLFRVPTSNAKPSCSS